MTETITRLENLLLNGQSYYLSADIGVVLHKPAPEKWSQKEMLGHLIDSAINNLQRFTEIQFEVKPFRIRDYNQNELPKANNYQDAKMSNLLNLWRSISRRIVDVIANQTEESLGYEVILDKDEVKDLRWLMTDYVRHMHHHVSQLRKSK
jgi:hypothetical protein